MKRWLSLVKRHVTPGIWAKPAKKRRPITLMPDSTPRDIYFMPAALTPPRKGAPTRTPTPVFYTAPLVPMRHPQPVYPPLCDLDLILSRHYAARSPQPLVSPVVRPDSQVLPLSDIAIPSSAYVDHSFIQFEPTFKVTVSEVAPYQLELRKPRMERFSRRIASYFHGETHGSIRFSAAIYSEE